MRDTKAIVAAMTLREKIAQLYQIGPFMILDEVDATLTGPLAGIGFDEDVAKILFDAGSMVGGTTAEIADAAATKHLENNRHGIPTLFMHDVIHGYKTIFPIPLAMGCSWNPDAVKKSAEIAALEASASGTQVTFSPMVDLVRDPRWGRVMESTGEDPYLNGLYAKAFVEGYQGDDVSRPGKIAACVKHFAAYGAAEAGRDYNTVDMSERMLRDQYLPAYKAAVDAGASMVMTSFNTVNSVPATANKWLFRDVLRGEWGFGGVTISDWGAINELIAHGVAEDGKEAAEKAIKAGIDIEMMTTEYIHHLESLVAEKKIDEALIDEAVLRILNLKDRLGLWEKPTKDADAEMEKALHLSADNRSAAREIAAESMVLLKNDGVLPFEKGKKVALIGPFGDEHRILGGWSGEGNPDDAITLKMGLEAKIGKENLIVSKGCDILGDEECFDAAVEAAKSADVVILAIGEDEGLSGEAASRAKINITGRQEELADKIFALGKPVAVVIFAGRPLDISALSEKAPAILYAWFPGTEGGNAACDLLFGDTQPSGRLTMSFPVAVGQIPVYYNHFNTGRPEPRGDDTYFYSRFRDIPNAPLYPFGYGLTYTSFEYANLRLDSSVLDRDGAIKVSADVKNTGERAGKEVVQLYIRDISGSVARPVKELKAFNKVEILPGETRTVEFEVREPMLRFVNAEMQHASEPGKFKVFVGGSANHALEADFELI